MSPPSKTTRRVMPVASELIRRLESAALKRNPGEFSRVLERALGVERDLAEKNHAVTITESRLSSPPRRSG